MLKIYVNKKKLLRDSLFLCFKMFWKKLNFILFKKNNFFMFKIVLIY
jgi:hypothetical protein